MKLSSFSRAALLSFVLFAVPSIARAEDSKTYQVTGPVLELTDSSITVQKGKERWQIARDKDAKVTGDLKVGSKVTVAYTMTAKTVDVKGMAKPDHGIQNTKTEK